MGQPDDGPSRTVLLVEDNAGDAELVRAALAGGEPPLAFRWAERLEEGLDAVAGVDVVLLDLSLPDSDGIATVRRWRHQAPDLPVVVLTGSRDDQLAREAMLHGAQDFLWKGHVSAGSLRRVLDHACERHRNLRRLEARGNELAQAVAARDQVLATATHELRSPLGVLRGVAAVLEERGDALDADRRRELLEAVGRQTERLEHLVEDLLELARHQGAGAPPEPSHVLVASLTERAVDDAFADRSLVDVQVGDIRWVTDAGRLRRILVNLLSNAGKYGRPPVTVSGTIADDRLVLVVRDEGEGVPEDVRARLFEPFTRSAVTASRPGTGLGLAIVARLVEGLGGTVEYAPSPLEGAARFVVSLPELEVPA